MVAWVAFPLQDHDARSSQATPWLVGKSFAYIGYWILQQEHRCSRTANTVLEYSTEQNKKKTSDLV